MAVAFERLAPSTIQTGIGGIPEAVLGLLRDRKDLGIHSEMVPDSVVDLIKAGVITATRKTVHPHKVIAGFVPGSKMLFDFIDNNPIFEIRRTAYSQRPVPDRAERPGGGDQFGDRSSAGGGAVEGRNADYHAAFDGEGRRGAADCADAAAGGGGGDVARGSALRDHGARDGVPAREDDPAARGGADRDRGPEVPGGTGGVRAKE